MLMPLISVCIPNYNYEKYVRDALESALNQTYENIEVVIVDDGSTDSSVDIIKSYQDPRIRLYRNEKNLGGYLTANRAVSLANGDFIAILHTDDKYHKNFLEEVVKAYNKYPEHKVFVTAICNQDSLLGKSSPDFPFNYEGIIPKKEVLIRLAYENPIGNGINVVVHRDALDRDNFYSLNCPLAGDYDLFFRLAENNDFVYINKVLTYYRRHEANLTNRVFLDMVKEGHETCKKHLSKSKVISFGLHKKLIRAQYKSMLNKSLYIGFKYNSKALAQDLLNFYGDTYPDLKSTYQWHLVYLSSFLINSFTSKYVTRPLFQIGRYYRAYIARNIDRLAISDSKKGNMESPGF